MIHSTIRRTIDYWPDSFGTILRGTNGLQTTLMASWVAMALLLTACSSETSQLVESAEVGNSSVPTTTIAASGSTTTVLPTTGPLTTRAAPDQLPDSAAAVLPTTTAPPETSALGATSAPDWLGSRVLPTSPDGRVPPQTTPYELIDRRLITADTLSPPPDDTFIGEIEAVSEQVAERSTWNSDCPVALTDLRYLRLSFWGFDGFHHQGEMIVSAGSAEAIVEVFAKLHAARFPIEEMRVVTDADLDAEPTGDGNNTSAFVCRRVTNGSVFSQHAFGLAVDINPFQNPYQRGDLVLPELATTYLDRDRQATGMVIEGDVVHTAFSDIGWSWGGSWQSLKDYQHFSSTGK